MAENNIKKAGFIELDEPQQASPIPMDQPEDSGSSYTENYIPLDMEPSQVSDQLGPKGIGPVAEGSEYAMALQPEVEKERSKPIGLGTVLRSAAETAFPPMNELTAKAYASAYPELTEDQWYRVLTERENKYHELNPVLSRVSDVAGASLIAAPVIAGAAAAGVPATAGVLGAMAYGGATAPWVTQKQPGDPGYLRETAQNTLVGVAAPVVAPGIVSAAMAPARVAGKLFGYGYAKVMSSVAKDPEVAQVYKNWMKDPSKYISITDPKEARTEIYSDMADALNALRSAAEEKRIGLKDVESSLSTLKSEYSDALRKVQQRARELGEAPSGTAEQIEKQFNAFKDHVYSIYDEAWEKAPTSAAWAGSPETYGLSIEDFARSMSSAVEKNTATMKGPEKIAVAEEAANLLKYHVGEMIDDALQQGVISKEAHDLFKVNQNWVYNPKTFISAINDPRNAKAFAAYGVSPKELVNSYRYINFMNPQEARNYSSSLFKRSSGFKSLADMADPKASMLKGEIGQKIAGDWRSIWLDKIGKHPQMKNWAEQNQIAYHFNNTFLKPLESRFDIKGAAKESTTRRFISAAQDSEDQILNSLRMASLVRGRSDQNLIDLASKLRASKQSLSSLSKLDMESAIKRLAENDQLADDTLSALTQLDPSFRSQFKELEDLAISAKNTKFIYNKLAKDAEDFVKKNKSALNMRFGSIEAAVNKLGTGRASNINMSNVRTEAEDGLRNLSTYMMNGDDGSANRAMQQLKNLREIGLLNRRAVRGSRETQQAAMLGSAASGVFGAATGAKVSPFVGASAGVALNTFADKFTNGKWSSITPWLIEKMMNKRIVQYKNGIGRGLISGVISREIGAGNIVDIQPGTIDAVEAVAIILADPKLTPKEKMEAIKKINSEGIVIGE